MAKQIARLLRTDVMADIDIPAIAQFLQSQGRRGDSILAHINAREAALLKKNGGAETVNPVTGLPEYFKISDYDYEYGADFANKSPQAIANQPFTSIEDDYINMGGGMFDLPEEPVTSSYYAPSSNLPYGATFDNSDITSAPTVSGYEPPVVYGMGGIPVYGGEPSAQPPVYDYSGALIPTSNIPRFGGEAIGQAGPVTARTVMPVRTAVPQPKIEEKGTIGRGIDALEKSTGLSREALGRLGLAGLGTIQGIRAAREASAQGREARRETEAIAQPYVQRGRELTEQAARGELTAQGQQSLQALRARLAQGAEARGGVGAAQAAAQIEAFRQNLLQNQFDYGQKISNIGDQLMLGAIRTGLEADRYAANLSNTYFTNMARVAAGIPAGVPTGTQGAQ